MYAFLSKYGCAIQETLGILFLLPILRRFFTNTIKYEHDCYLVSLNSVLLTSLSHISRYSKHALNVIPFIFTSSFWQQEIG
jgi:hypothetical protein